MSFDKSSISQLECIFIFIIYHTQLAKMSFDKKIDLNAGVYFYFYNIIFEGKSPTYILNEDSHPVIRAIGVSHTACKDEFRQNLRSHSWSVFLLLKYIFWQKCGSDVRTRSSNVVLCRVCGFRVRVWESYRTDRSSGYGYGSVTELTEVPGIVAQAYITHRNAGYGIERLYPYPGYCGIGEQNSQKI